MSNCENLSSDSSESEIGSDASYETLKKVWRKQQAERNHLIVQLHNKDKVIADVTNKDLSARDPPSSQNPATKLLKKDLSLQGQQQYTIKKIAHKFTYMNMLWLWHPKEVFALEVDPDYSPVNRFRSVEENQQGMLLELRQEIPVKWHSDMQNQMLIRIFTSEMTQQRGNGSTRVRQAGPLIFDCSNAVFHNDQVRSNTFKADIGFIVNENGVGGYKMRAPILYKGYEGKADKWKMFRNPVLMRAYSALVRGVSSIQGLSEGAVTRPNSHSTLESQWGVRYITLAAIAMASIYTRFAASEDTRFQAEGSTTKIAYQHDYEFYLKFLAEGLAEEAPCVTDIFKIWNEQFYPETCSQAVNAGSLSDDENQDIEELRQEGQEYRKKRQEQERSCLGSPLESDQQTTLTESDSFLQVQSQDGVGDTMEARMTTSRGHHCPAASSPLTDLENPQPLRYGTCHQTQINSSVDEAPPRRYSKRKANQPASSRGKGEENMAPTKAAKRR